MSEQYRSRVYTDRPDYADFSAPAKFQAIESIIAKRLREHPKAICSYSGGSDSDILIDLIERVRMIFSLPSVEYAFFNTGLEMRAIKNHVEETAEKYGVKIEAHRPKIGIVTASRKYGIPFVSKIMSAGLPDIQKAIAKAMAERSKRTGVNQDRIVLELAKLALVNMADIVDKKGEIKDTATADDLSCIESIKYKHSDTDSGSSVEREVKIGSKIKALELLGKHLGMWNDKVDVNVAVPIVISGEDALED